MTPGPRPRITLADLAAGAEVLCRMPIFLRRPFTPREARVILNRRLERRQTDFIDLVRRTVYSRARSPYLQLLRLAACEYGDFDGLVRRDGVEEALGRLYHAGVYFTLDEFKGRKPVVRGSTTMMVEPAGLRSPLAGYHVPRLSGGSRGGRTVVPVNLAFIRDYAVNKCLTLEARGGLDWQHAVWADPGGASIAWMLQLSSFGARPVGWFSQIDPAAPDLDVRYRWGQRVTRWGGLLAGIRFPEPVYASIEDPIAIARWIADELRSGRVPHLQPYASSAVRLCQAAERAGLDLRGAQLTLVGEPTTEARLRVFRRSGVEGVPSYAITEYGRIGDGCLAPVGPDDVHLLHDLVAMIQAGAEGAVRGLPETALLYSSLRATAPFVLLNVSMGDQAVVSTRACGCPLQQLGWTTHLQTIRSFEKLTAGGVTFLDADLIRVLEEVLPSRFGGDPTDYQLVEEETSDGTPRLRLFVHPALGPLDSDLVRETFLQAIARSFAERAWERQWREAGLLTVERQPPRATPVGKILHLHVERQSRAPS